MFCCVAVLGCQESRVWKIFARQRSSEDFNFHCNLDLEHNNPIFAQDTPEYDDDVPST